MRCARCWWLVVGVSEVVVVGVGVGDGGLGVR